MGVTNKDMQLYVITDSQWLNGRSLESQVEAALAGGATFLQLRDKTASHAELVAEAEAIREIAAKYHVPFVVNDDVMAARESGADGVHIGQGDMSCTEARAILGPDKIIGMTAKTVEQAVSAQQQGADYIGVGSVFHTSTKADAKGISRETLLAITDSVQLPVVAIGGISYENADYLKHTGASGIAVVSAVFAQPDVKLAAERLAEKTRGLFDYSANDIIFDMDGTLLDSMPYWRMEARAFASRRGIVLPPDFDEVTYHMDLDTCSMYFREVLGVRDEPAKIISEVVEHMNRHYRQDIPMKPGMRRLLEDEHGKGSRMCLFTSSDADCASAAMERMGVLDYFGHIYTSYDIGISKQEPAAYLKICKLMGFEPSGTVVYEDVFHGVKSAKEAGCRVVAVYDEQSAAKWPSICRLADDAIRF